MASITVRNLDDGLKRRLRIRAAENGRSMEQEARDILRAALDHESWKGPDLATAIRARFAPLAASSSTCRPVSQCANHPNSTDAAP